MTYGRDKEYRPRNRRKKQASFHPINPCPNLKCASNKSTGRCLSTTLQYEGCSDKNSVKNKFFRED